MLKKIDINFNWKYSPDFKEDYKSNDFDDENFETVHIPHSNITMPYNNFDEKIYQFESCYRKKIWIDKIEENSKLFIKFEGVMTYAKVYLNSNYIGEHKGGYTPFRLDLTDSIIPQSENTLVIYVDSRERDDIPPFGYVVDYLTYGGIYREVSLEYCNIIHIENVGIRTKDLLTEFPKLFIDLYIHNEEKLSQTLKVKCTLMEEDNPVYTFYKNINIAENNNDKITLEEDLSPIIKDIKFWDIDNPNLYYLKIDLIQEGLIIDKHHIRVGFRDINFTNEGFYLNRKKLKLMGLNRHQSFPYVGYAMPKNAQYKDAELLKYDLGVNIVRLSHYPQSNHFMDRCDEIGLLVFDEIPGWQHIGDKNWQKLSLENVKEMILKDINHPSVIIWGVRINESQDLDEFYKKTNQLARELDDSRPTAGVRNLAHSNLFEDIYTYNDFVHNGKNQGLENKSNITKTDKPYMVTEYNGHMFPTKKFDNESHRVKHAIRHLKVIEAMKRDSQIIGAIGWCMFDYNTHKEFGSGDKICYHGVMDMYRIPKDAAYVYSSQQDKIPVMHISSSLNIGEYKGSLLEDIYVFTNCDYIKLYKNDLYIKTFYPSKSEYPSVSNPPIIIDDLIGDGIKENENFSPSDSKVVKDILINVSKNGMDLSLTDKIKMGWIFFKYKMNMGHAEDLYTKYFGGWGDASTNYTLEGYLQDQCILKTVKSQVSTPKLIMEVDSKTLIEDITYDTTRITIKLVDDYGNSIIYANDTFTIDTEGPIEIIGPKVISLIGGSIGFWVKTKGSSGIASIILTSERFGILKEKIVIEKNDPIK